MTVQAVFFDLDGCLVDSRSAIPAAINAALAGLGLPRQPPESLLWCIGPPLLDSFRTLLVELGSEPAAAHEAVDRYRDAYPAIAARETTAVPGITDALSALSDGRHLAVVTSKPAPFAAPLLEAVGLSGWFRGLFAPATDELEEPKAVSLQRALDAAGVPPAQAAMVGDRIHDIEAGRTCGTLTVGVTWGIGDGPEFASANHVVTTPSALVDVLIGDRPAGDIMSRRA